VNPEEKKALYEQASVTPLDITSLTPEQKDNLQAYKQFGDDIVVVKNLCKSFSLPGREEVVHALRNVNLSHATDIYPIRQVRGLPFISCSLRNAD
jgi:hypothetical protein